MPIKMVLVGEGGGGGGGGSGIRIGKKLIQLAENSLQDKKNRQKMNISIKYCQSCFAKRFESVMNLIVARRISRFSHALNLESPYR